MLVNLFNIREDGTKCEGICDEFHIELHIVFFISFHLRFSSKKTFFLCSNTLKKCYIKGRTSQYITCVALIFDTFRGLKSSANMYFSTWEV
jgi:hypothetical protein